MRLISKSAVCMALLAGATLPACWAQKWEVGVLGGGSFYTNATVTSGAASGKVGFKPGLVVGGYLANNTTDKWGGELRYMYRPGNLKLSSGGTEVTLNGESHAIHYDFLYHFAPMEAHIRPFVAFGGGVKVYRGTGALSATQPLSNLAFLTDTYETAGMGSVGAGFKVAVSPRVGLRFEVHDYITPFPKQVLAPALGASVGRVLNDFVVSGGISFTF